MKTNLQLVSFFNAKLTPLMQIILCDAIKKLVFVFFVITPLFASTFAEECRPRDFKKGDFILANRRTFIGLEFLEVERVDVENGFKLITDQGTVNAEGYCLFVAAKQISNDNTGDEFARDQLVLAAKINGYGYVGKIRRISANGFVEIDKDWKNAFYKVEQVQPVKTIDQAGGFSIGDCVLDKKNKSHEIDALYEDNEGDAFANINDNELMGVHDSSHVSHISILRPDPNDDCKWF